METKMMSMTSHAQIRALDSRQWAQHIPRAVRWGKVRQMWLRPSGHWGKLCVKEVERSRFRRGCWSWEGIGVFSNCDRRLDSFPWLRWWFSRKESPCQCR